MTDYEIQKLLEGCRKNHRKSQELFYHWLKDFAVKICYAYTSNAHELDDLVSEGFIKVFKNIHLYNDNLYGTSEAAFRGWFKRVLVNQTINYLRSQHKLIIEEANEVTLIAVEDNCASALDTMSFNEIVDCIKQLPTAYRTVFNLYVMEGLSHEEIGGMLGINAGTSRSNLFKAKEHLRKMINQKIKIAKNA